MATIKEIRNKMLSIQNIEKLTKTMERVATAKVNQKRSALERFRLFSDEWIHLYKAIEHEDKSDFERRIQQQPLFQHNPSISCHAVFAITSNRGLCGAYNQHIIASTKSYMKDLNNAQTQSNLYMMGNKGIQHFNYHQLPLTKAIHYSNPLQLQEIIHELSDNWVHQYINQDIGYLDVIYTAYLSAGKQVTEIKRVLPLDQTSFKPFESILRNDSKPWNLLFLHEPDMNRVLDVIIHQIVRLQLYGCVVDSILSEEIQRKIAMKQASESAYDMISQLRLSYNRARQEKITKELIEIMGTVNAL